MNDTTKEKIMIVTTIIFVALMMILTIGAIKGLSIRTQQLNDMTDSRDSYKLALKETTTDTDSYELKYVKGCFENIDMLYKDSKHKIHFGEICTRQYAVLLDHQIQNCINFTYSNGTQDYLCGFAEITVITDEMVKRDITNMSIYRRYKPIEEEE